MIKWLSISLFVLSVFLFIMLGFGVLLNDNEKQHEAYNRQLEQKKRQQQQLSHNNENIIVTTEPKVNPENNEQKKSINLAIVANNLTCVANEQCTVVAIGFADLTCTVAVNIIGADQLKKAEQDETNIGQCDNVSKSSKAVCLDNFCTLSVSN